MRDLIARVAQAQLVTLCELLAVQTVVLLMTWWHWCLTRLSGLFVKPAPVIKRPEEHPSEDLAAQEELVEALSDRSVRVMLRLREKSKDLWQVVTFVVVVGLAGHKLEAALGLADMISDPVAAAAVGCIYVEVVEQVANSGLTGPA